MLCYAVGVKRQEGGKRHCFLDQYCNRPLYLWATSPTSRTRRESNAWPIESCIPTVRQPGIEPGANRWQRFISGNHYTTLPKTSYIHNPVYIYLPKHTFTQQHTSSDTLPIPICGLDQPRQGASDKPLYTGDRRHYRARYHILIIYCGTGTLLHFCCPSP